MQQKVKHRLIGLAVILISAAVIFPLFFDGSGYKERHLQSKIPAIPERPEIVRIKPKNKPLSDTSIAAEPSAPANIPPRSGKVQQMVKQRVEKEKINLDIRNDQPVLDQQGVPVAWTLQLASFKDEVNAKSLRKQLIAEGYKVFTRKQGGLIKVYVGPELQKTRLESLKEKLKTGLGLDGMIVRFTTQ